MNEQELGRVGWIAREVASGFGASHAADCWDNWTDQDERDGFAVFAAAVRDAVLADAQAEAARLRAALTELHREALNLVEHRSKGAIIEAGNTVDVATTLYNHVAVAVNKAAAALAADAGGEVTG